ncbi:hypothetical protein [Winogradskyella schleiferi]|uniref:hypothetical protein n=1 Tax=Winogradskyella schleiferi TaxID=2686078 RepID=UPI0015BBFAEB|nr:hypothetical protein [Winogradskyella schleiferi]
MKQFRIILFLLTIAWSSNVMSQTVYSTKTGEKYHTENCRYLKYSKKAIDLNKAKALGYAACKVCKPTMENIKISESEPSSIAPEDNRKIPTKKTTSSQCTGKTKAGKRCKRQTKNTSGRCYQH